MFLQVTDVALDWDIFNTLSTVAISGPPTGRKQGPFTWTGDFDSWPQVGLPAVYNYTVVQAVVLTQQLHEARTMSTSI